MKKILVCFLMLSCLVGCSNEKTTVCKIDEDGYINTNTLVSKDDYVSKQTLITEFNYEKQGFTLEEIENLAELCTRFYDVEGIDYTYKVKEISLVETITVDYNVVKLDDIIQLRLLKSLGNIVQVPLEKVITELEETGYICE